MPGYLLEVEDLKKHFVKGTAIDRLLGTYKLIKAVDGVSFKLKRGETLALVGESGSGKTTTGKLVLRLLQPTSGRIVFDGTDITWMSEKELRAHRPRMQMIFQDPYASLKPRMSIGSQIAEPLVVHGLAGKTEARRQALEMLERVGLTPARDFYNRKPAQLSGGQRQRAVIARAMILKPDLIVADEPVSMIDVSMRTSILKLLLDFKQEYNMSMIMITHDLAVARLVAEQTAVMYLGRIVEIGPTEDVLRRPRHPYTEALIAAAPTIVRGAPKPELRIKGEIADPAEIPGGCRFHPRCPYNDGGKCTSIEPRLEGDKHKTACHYPL